MASVRPLLPREGQVRSPGGERRQAAAAARGEEQPAEAASGGGTSGQRGAQGPARDKLVTPAARRRALEHLLAAHRCSERRRCGLVGAARSVARYRSRRRDDAEMRARVRDLVGQYQYRRFGYLRLHALLRREGPVITARRATARIGWRIWRCAVVVGAARRSASACAWSCPRGAISAGRWTLRVTPCGPAADFAACGSSMMAPGKPAAPGRLLDWRRTGRAPSRRTRVPARPAAGDRHRQRSGIHRSGALRLVGTNRGTAALHPAQQANPERVRRGRTWPLRAPAVGLTPTARSQPGAACAS